MARRLGDKYTEILALRDAHARGEDPPDVRMRMRALAARFPGALRELDRMPREVIVERLAALARGERAPWMDAIDRYHRWLRVGLRRPRLLPRSGGRLVPAVVDRVGAELGLTPVEVEALLGLATRRASAAR